MEPIAAVFCLCFVSSSRIPLSIKPTIQVCNYTLYTLYFSSNVNLDVVLTLLEISKRSIRKKRTISQVLLCYCILDRSCGFFYPSSSEKITG